MNYYGPTGSSQAWLFTNTGSQFTRSTIELGAQVWGHGTTIADLTKTGWMDAIITDYGPNTTFLMNNRVNGFTVYQAKGNNDLFWGTSSIAAADFLNNGKIEVYSSIDTGIDMGDAGKFYKVQEYDNSYYLSIDDDLIYPSDYVSNIINNLNKYNNDVIISHHGRTLKPDAKSYYNDAIIKLKCLNLVNNYQEVQFGGTGVMGFHTNRTWHITKCILCYFMFPYIFCSKVGK
jgi:hypothetical protein